MKLQGQNIFIFCTGQYTERIQHGKNIWRISNELCQLTIPCRFRRIGSESNNTHFKFINDHFFHRIITHRKSFPSTCLYQVYGPSSLNCGWTCFNTPNIIGVTIQRKSRRLMSATYCSKDMYMRKHNLFYSFSMKKTFIRKFFQIAPVVYPGCTYYYSNLILNFTCFYSWNWRKRNHEDTYMGEKRTVRLAVVVVIKTTSIPDSTAYRELISLVVLFGAANVTGSGFRNHWRWWLG